MFYNDLCDTIVDDSTREAEWKLSSEPTIDTPTIEVAEQGPTMTIDNAHDAEIEWENQVYSLSPIGGDPTIY